MKLMKKTLLASAIATSMLSSGAFAATVNNPSTAATPTYGKAIVNETVRTTITPVATVVTLGAGESLSVDDSITFTLSGGATFAAVAAGDLTVAPNVGGAAFALVSGGVGENTVTFRVTNSATDVAAALTLAATATHNGSAVADNGNVQTTVDMKGFVGGSAISLFGSPLISLTENLVPMQTATIAAVTGVFDVAAGFQQLTSATSSDGAAPFNSSNTATVTVTTNAAAVANQTTTGVPTAGPTPANTILTIKGPMTGVTSIGVTGGVTSSTATGGTPTAGTVANVLDIDLANNAAYGIATGAGPYVVTFNFDETVVHEASAYTADVTRTADAAGYTATSVSTGTTAATFTRNGSSFTSNSVGPLNKLTVTDRSGAIGAGGADGAITISAFDAAGAAVTCTGLSIANLANNGTVTIEGSDLTSACSGAKRVEGIVNSTSIIVTNVKKTADGATATPALSASGGTAGI